MPPAPSYSLIDQILDCPTDLSAWTLLETKRPSFQATTQLLQQLYGLRLHPSESLTNYMARARTLCTELTTSGCVIGIPDVIMTVLAGLPSPYATIVSILESSDDVRTLEQLLPHEYRIKQSDEEGSVRAFYSKGSSSLPPFNGLPNPQSGLQTT